MIIGLAILICTTFKILTSESFNTFYIPLLTSGFVIFGSTLIYYIRWGNAWLCQHAEAEFQNLQFSKDILRASWLAELIIEGKMENGTIIPEYILEQYSKNLFNIQKINGKHHPIDDLFKLSKSLKKIKLNKTGIELEKQDN